jgi:6-pyruvoyltetrahydropterin/6-carboxytetrahydropterin synthase
VEVAGPLDENRYVFDFIALRDAAHELALQLDHHILLPTEHPMIRVTENEREVTTTFEERRWVFPREDCVLLPIANTTAELIAHWIAGQLKDRLQKHPGGRLLESLAVEVEENFGQTARVDIDITSDPGHRRT